MTHLIPTAPLCADPECEVRRAIADRQALVHQLDEAEAQIVELAEELILLRKELADTKLQLALERTARAVTGQSVAEVNAELDVRAAETFDEIFDDTIDVVMDDVLDAANTGADQ